MYSFEQTATGWIVFWGEKPEHCVKQEKPCATEVAKPAMEPKLVNFGESLAGSSFELALTR